MALKRERRLVGSALLCLSLAAVSPAAAQIIVPGQTGQDLPQVPTIRPRPPADADPSWTLRDGQRPPPRRWERRDGFAPPPAYGGRRDARPRSPYLEDSRR